MIIPQHPAVNSSETNRHNSKLPSRRSPLSIEAQVEPLKISLSEPYVWNLRCVDSERVLATFNCIAGQFSCRGLKLLPGPIIDGLPELSKILVKKVLLKALSEYQRHCGGI